VAHYLGHVRTKLADGLANASTIYNLQFQNQTLILELMIVAPIFMRLLILYGLYPISIAHNHD
jgi:hypothetical protein